MNIVFFGSSQFAVPALRALSATQHKVSCVVTQPDRPKGRGLHFAGTLVKALAQTLGLEVYQPEGLNSQEAIKFLKGLSPDLFVVLAYGQIFSQEVLNIPKIFSLNAHASCLPKYRGAAPINWAMIKGEKVTGITLIKMVKGLDAGPIIAQEEAQITNEDTAITLEDNLSQLAAELLSKSLAGIESNNYPLTPQDENKVSFAPKLQKEDGRINWERPAEDIYNLIRGLLPWPGAFTRYQNKLLKIYKARVSCPVSLPVSYPAGKILEASKEGIVIAAGRDNLIIEALQMEGKRRLEAGEFIAGHEITIGERLE